MSIKTLKWNIGSHIDFKGDLFNTIENAIRKGMYSLQFFMGSKLSYKRTKITKKDISKTQKLIDKFPISVFTHAPYCFNLAGSKNILAWDNNKAQDNKTMNMLQNLEYEINIIGTLNGGVVVHPGNHIDRERGLRAISKSINKIKFEGNSHLLLENSAGQGTSLATMEVSETSTVSQASIFLYFRIKGSKFAEPTSSSPSIRNLTLQGTPSWAFIVSMALKCI